MPHCRIQLSLETQAGTIIGKSLENFTGESGVIEVAVGRF
jgi:hypothetical protein